MTGVGIEDGDWVLIDTQIKPGNGDLAVFRYQGGNHVRTYRVRGRSVILEPASPAGTPLLLDQADSMIGKAVALYRIYK